jgi:hypothetical protein
MGAAGFTLLEVLLGVGLLLGGVAVLLFGMHFAMVHSEYLAQMQIARSAAQGLLERLSATPFATLAVDPQFTEARVVGQGQPCFLEDLNCNRIIDLLVDVDGDGVLDPGDGDSDEDVNDNGRLDSDRLFGQQPFQELNGVVGPNTGDRFGAALVVQIRDPRVTQGVPIGFELLDVHIAACWSHRGRAMSEDIDCDGVLDEDNSRDLSNTEDPNQNGWVDSPVMVSTRIGKP